MAKKKCYSCKFRGDGFKIDKLTHYHCYSPSNNKEFKEKGFISPWETLRVFSDTCKEHKFK